MILPCLGYAYLLSRGGPHCCTFQQITRKLGLVEDEDEYYYALREAAQFMLGPLAVYDPLQNFWDAFPDSHSEEYLPRNGYDPELAYKLFQTEINQIRQWSCLADHGLSDVQDDTTELGRELMI
jgi:hypothetical protein